MKDAYNIITYYETLVENVRYCIELYYNNMLNYLIVFASYDKDVALVPTTSHWWVINPTYT